MNALFVCRGNLQRSPTAEDMLRERAGEEVNAKSAGVNRTAQTRVNRELLDWADRVYVMMEGIRKRLEEEFPNSLEEIEIKVLGIPDRYRRGEPRLKRRLLEEFSRDDFLSRYVDEGDQEKFGEEGEKYPFGGSSDPS